MESKKRLPDPSKSSGREEWVDILRGLAVFMVILGHLYKGYYYHVVVNPIKMPVFYFIAGYVASIEKPLRQVVKKRIMGLFIPMFVFSLFPIRLFYYLVIQKNLTVTGSYLAGFIDGSINWFIYSFFISSILFACLYKVAKRNHLIFGIMSTICFAVGILSKDTSIMKIWSLNTALTSVLFMYMGYEFRINHWEIFNCRWIMITGVLVYFSLLGISMTFYKGKMLNYHLCSYYNLPVCFAMIASGIVVLRYVFIKLSTEWNGRFKTLVVRFGQNTIVVYLASSTFNAIIISGFKKFIGSEAPGFFICFIGAIISCMLGYMVSVFCRKHIPILLGVRKNL